MPKELLGYYWDEEKKRYFPNSMKPKLPMLHVPEETQGDEPSRKRRRIEGGIPTFSALQKLRTSYGSSSRRRSALHDIFASSLSLTCGGAAYPVVSAGHITSICAEDASSYDPERRSVTLGDSSGWLYSIRNADPDRPPKSHVELNIGSSVSAICSWGTRRVATSFGWPCKIFIRDIAPVERWTILSMPEVMCHDVSTAALEDRTMALGAGGRCVVVPDLEVHTGLLDFYTGSDVLGIAMDRHLIYVGSRSGFVQRFDTRVPKKEHCTILNHRFWRSPNSITHLSLIHQNALLVGTIRGDLETHDIRFLRDSDPLLRLSGHVNACMTKLGLAIDPSEDFVFAAGQDQRIRGWSLRTGKRLPAQPVNSRAAVSDWHDAPAEKTRLFDVLFDAPVAAMQVARGDEGLCLWAACGGDVYRMSLCNSSVVG
ncbi:uncharacterized protein C8Q71DRAFT_738699 [Rhodofomes roseus]|uniref:WD40 repeat protein n=1 Tax=Rhodofomes roseus TaxID=34475 RepID=A0ABQ8KSG8_9APHY|nr:uncharacterized protein C8Q71DRAFT_738699 [Rhodofomes roseus]KAH9841761.1 hypothetical protein C8Q71DRAFT_738699 [Rhodofomes roseus]